MIVHLSIQASLLVWYGQEELDDQCIARCCDPLSFSWSALVQLVRLVLQIATKVDALEEQLGKLAGEH